MSKKIAVIASSLHPIKQKHLLDWYNDISFENKKIQLFLGSKINGIPFAKNYKVNTKADKLKYAVSNLIHFKKRAKELKKIQPLFNYKPSIIHLLTSNVFPHIKPILQDKNIKLIVSFRGFDINVFPNHSKENLEQTQQIFKRADILHFISEDLKLTAISLGADPIKCRIIHRSIQIDSRKIFYHPTSNFHKPIVLSVGRLVWEKGYLYALEAVGILKNKGYNFEYHIVGKGIDYNALVYHTYRLNIQDRVKFLGELTRGEVEEKLINADIYFQPSLTEALSMAILEASYYGLPIVSSNIGGIPEVVENLVSGLLSAPCKPLEYAENIIKLIEDPNLRIQMGKNGHARIKRDFSRETELVKWKEVYLGL